MKEQYLALKVLEEFRPNQFKSILESKEMQNASDYEAVLKHALDVHFSTKAEELKFKPDNVTLMIEILLKRSLLCS